MNNQAVYIVSDDALEDIVGGASAVEYALLVAFISLTGGKIPTKALGTFLERMPLEKIPLIG
ncbi:TPA: hypothetical protein I8038_000269 [Legionella pneumophila]|nr:hypothetical protein [Legionella pneumophila]